MERVVRIVLAAILLLTTTVAADTLRVPEDFGTVQSAIDAASSGDFVSVGPGTYNELLDMQGKAIRLFGRDGAAATTIDATGLGGSAIVCMNGETSETVIAGLTLTGGTGTLNPVWQTLQGGGIFIYTASPTVVNCVLTLNTSEFGGGGIWAQNSESYLANLRFDDNHTLLETRGGGGMYLWNSSATVMRCSFSNNTADSGGGLRCKGGGSAYIRRCSFVNNESFSFGGAVAVTGATPAFDRCLFDGNVAASYGGAVSTGGVLTTFLNCYFRENVANTTGGAIRVNDGGAEFDGCDFASNLAGLGGGGIVVNDSACTVTRGSFQENDGTSNGGAIHLTGVSSVDVDLNFFCGNQPTTISGDWNDLGGNAIYASCSTTCPGDIDANGTVDLMDALSLIAQWGQCDGVSSCFADQNDDGQVNVADLIIVIENFGACP